MTATIIAAVADNRVIGRDNQLPWHLPADLRHFKRTTLGHHLIMGRKTFESIGGPLPGRTTVVISRGAPELPEGVVLAGSLEEALAAARAAGDDQAFIVGGAAIFGLALAVADRFQLTRVHARPAGDCHFPEWDPADWRLLTTRVCKADQRNEHPMTFELYERRLAG